MSAPRRAAQPLPVGCWKGHGDPGPPGPGATKHCRSSCLQGDFCSFLRAGARPRPIHSLHPARELLKCAQVKIILVTGGGLVCNDTGGGSVLRQQSLSQPRSPALPLDSSSQRLHEIQLLLQPRGSPGAWGQGPRCHLGFPGHPPCSRAARSWNKWKVRSSAPPARSGPRPWGPCERLCKRTFGVVRAVLPLPHAIHSRWNLLPCWTVSR